MNLTQTLDSNYSFENLVTGKENHLAYAEALKMADSPVPISNPLYIHGAVGVGKTHLLHAIGNQFNKNNSHAKICFVHATTYLSSVVRAFMCNKLDELKEYYNSMDLLLVDDIEFIADKPRAQQEFLSIINSLTSAKKRVAITGNTFLEVIPGIEPHLVSRFGCDLAVALEPPELNMRVAILRKKAIMIGNPIGEDVALFVAEHVDTNIRELEGALNSIFSYSRFHKQEVSVDLVSDAIFTAPYSRK